MSVNTKLHTKYFLRCLDLLPASATEYDSSRTALAYFCVSGLSLLGTLETSTTPEQRKQWADWILSNLVISGEGFRGSYTHKLENNDRALQYDCANVPSTYFSIMSLGALREERLKELNRIKICEYIGRCQRPDGSFAPNWSPSLGPFGENDGRCNYMAAGVFKALGADAETTRRLVDIPQALNFIISTISYDGGMGQGPGTEAHAGLTFCGLASLDIFLSYDNKSLAGVHDWRKTRLWLSRRQISEPCHHSDERQVGGLNGRTGKAADTCYAFWVSAALAILDPSSESQIIDVPAAEKYLLEVTQHSILGGFAKYEGNHPDQLHSFLGLAALSIMRRTKADLLHLEELVPPQVITLSTAKWFEQLWL